MKSTLVPRSSGDRLAKGTRALGCRKFYSFLLERYYIATTTWTFVRDVWKHISQHSSNSLAEMPVAGSPVRGVIVC
jgi:hypothetical protein